MIRLTNFLTCFLLITLCCAVSVFSQDEAKFGEADANKAANGWKVSVDFDAEFDPGSFSGANFRIIDVQSQQGLQIEGSPQAADGFIKISLAATESLDCTKPYIIYVSGLVFPRKPTKELFTRLNVHDPQRCPSPPSRIGDGSAYKLGKVDSGLREDADIFISGQLTGANKQKVQYTADIKIEPNLKRTAGTRVLKYGPSLELLASTVTDADPDSLKAGFYISFFPWVRNDGNNPRAVRVKWKNTFALESDREFRNTNYLWDTRFTYVANSYKFGERCNTSACVYFRPFIGQELGFNIKSPLLEARRKLIYRPYFGASLSTAIPINRSIDEMIFDVSYIRRFPLKREVTFAEDDDGNLAVVRFGRNPKDLVKSNLQFVFNDFWTAKISYEYGSLPPLHKLLDHKFGVGLTFLGSVKPQ